MNNSSKYKGYLICEASTFSYKPKIMKVTDKSVTFDSVLQEADEINRNKRLYKKDVINGGLNAELVQEKIKNNSFVGEAGHPLSPDLKRQVYINQSNISHIVKNYRWENNFLHGTVQTACTDRGRDMMGMITENDTRVAFSLRALGPVVENKRSYMEVKAPITIISYDWVFFPSHKNAYMEKLNECNSVLNESGNTLLYESGVFSAINNNELISYIKERSQNYKEFKKQFDLDLLSNYSLSEDGRYLYVKNNGETLAILMENYVREDINDFYKSFYKKVR